MFLISNLTFNEEFEGLFDLSNLFRPVGQNFDVFDTFYKLSSQTDGQPMFVSLFDMLTPFTSELQGPVSGLIIRAAPADTEIIGTEEADEIYGAERTSGLIIRALGGDDLIDVRVSYEATIYAGDGNDRVFGALGDTTIYGGAGNDRLLGFSGDNDIFGGTGDDIIRGGIGEDKLYGEDGNDTIDGKLGWGYIYGGAAGDDYLRSGKGNDIIYGGEGNDTLFSEGGNDILFGEDGDDFLSGGRGIDTLTGGAGADTFSFFLADISPGGRIAIVTDFTIGEDVLSLTGISDEEIQRMLDTAKRTDEGLLLDSNNDVSNTTILLKGLTLRDLESIEVFEIEGRSRDFDSRLVDDQGMNHLVGDMGRNLLVGLGGNDTLSGDAGDDILIGGFGDDLLSGGAGNDSLTGGSGRDVFVIGQGDDVTIVEDFRNNQDMLDLSDFSDAEIQTALIGAAQDGEHTVVTFASGEIIQLLQFDLADLSADDILSFDGV